MAERRSGLMTLSRRGSAVCFAAVLILHLALFPVRARAMSSAAVALAAVGGATVIAATLAACGVYPYASAGERSFGEWGARALTDLLARYNEQAGRMVIQEEALKAYVVGRTLAISREAWEKLQAFVAWCRETFNLADDDTDVNIGNASVQWIDGYLRLPRAVSTPSVSWMVDNGGIYYYSWNSSTASSSTSTAPVYYATSWGKPIYMGFYRLSSSPSGVCAVLGWRYSDVSSASRGPSCYNYSAGYSWSNDAWVLGSSVNSNWLGSYQTAGRNYISAGYIYGVIPDGAVVFDTESAFGAAINGASDTSGSVGTVGSDFTLDTGTVTALPDVSADADFVGLSIFPGTVQGIADTPVSPMTAEKIEQAIQQGVMERQRPDVRPTDVTLAPGTTLDAETGVVSSVTVTDMGGTVDTGATADAGATAIDSGVTIDLTELAESYVPAVSELAAPQAFLDSLVTAMQTKFPFCLPFDVMRLLSAFVKPPRAPVIGFTFHDPFTDADYTFSVDLSPWDDVAAIVRQMESILLFCGFWLNFDKFNVLNIILGSLG